jgi:CheY-like chemotaxis protein
MSRLAVLVVDDVPQVRATAVQLFKELGCEVFDAYNGHQALKLLQAHPEIQVLFADVRMPGMNGTELAAAAQHLRPDLRIVLTSGYVGPKDLPADISFVPKPWRAGDIAGVVIGAPSSTAGLMPGLSRAN